MEHLSRRDEASLFPEKGYGFKPFSGDAELVQLGERLFRKQQDRPFLLKTPQKPHEIKVFTETHQGLKLVTATVCMSYR